MPKPKKNNLGFGVVTESSPRNQNASMFGNSRRGSMSFRESIQKPNNKEDNENASS